MKTRTPLLAAVAALLASVAFAQTQPLPTAIVTPASAPNAFGSPSYAAWVDNSIQGQFSGAASFGAAGTPSHYSVAPTTMTVLDNIVTGFPSWKGFADPGTMFGPGFAAELGNRLHFGLDLLGNQGLISIDKVGFDANSTDATNSLGFSFAMGSFSYSSQYRGLLYGVDGIRGTPDDVWITGGASSQLVNEIIGRGSGNAWAVYAADPGATYQDKINQAASTLYGDLPFSFTGTYSYNGTSVGSATVRFVPGASVPDSGTTVAFVGLALLGLAGLRSRALRSARRR